MAGGRFSAADVYLGSQIGWGLETMKTIDERPVFVDFWKRVRARKAYHRANALDDALLPEQPTSDQSGAETRASACGIGPVVCAAPEPAGVKTPSRAVGAGRTDRAARR